MDWTSVKEELRTLKDNAYQRNMLLKRYWNDIEVIYSQVGVTPT